MKKLYSSLVLLGLVFSLMSCKEAAKNTTTAETETSADSAVDPHANEMVVTQIACGSCYKPHAKSSHIWGAIAATKPQIFLFMGDNIYADTHDMDVMRAKYQKLITHPGFAKFAKTHKVLPIWDDHDYGQNDAGREYPEKVESQKNFLNAFGFASDHPARKRKGVYYSYYQGPKGKRLQVILLDTRYHRSPLIQKSKGKFKYYAPVTDPAATMLGAEQWKWLQHELTQPADLRIIVSSIQLISSQHPFEKWQNIPAERQRFFELLKQTKAHRVVLLSGDRHMAEISILPAAQSGLDYDLTEMTTSGMTHAGAWGMKNKYRLKGSYTGKKNFGTLSIDWKKSAPPEVQLTVRLHDGTVVKKHTVRFRK